MATWEFSSLVFTPDAAPVAKASWTGPDGCTTSYDRRDGDRVLAELGAQGWEPYTVIELVGQAYGYRAYRMRRQIT